MRNIGLAMLLVLLFSGADLYALQGTTRQGPLFAQEACSAGGFELGQNIQLYGQRVVQQEAGEWNSNDGILRLRTDRRNMITEIESSDPLAFTDRLIRPRLSTAEEVLASYGKPREMILSSGQVTFAYGGLEFSFSRLEDAPRLTSEEYQGLLSNKLIQLKLTGCIMEQEIPSSQQISLLYEPETQAIYAVAGRNKTLYRLNHLNNAFEPLRNLQIRGEDSHHIFVTDGGGVWIASLSQMGLGSTFGNLITLTRFFPEAPQQEAEPTTPAPIINIGKFVGADFAPDSQTIVVADSKRGGIYGFRVSEGTLDRSAPLDHSMREPVSVAVWGEKILVGDRDRRAVVQLDLSSGTSRVLVDGIAAPIGLSVALGGSGFAVTDPDRGRVLFYDFATGKVRVVLDRSRGLKKPVSVLAISPLDIWIGDTGAQKLVRVYGRI